MTVQYEDIFKKIKNLKIWKVSQQSDIPIKMLIENCNTLLSIFMKIEIIVCWKFFYFLMIWN